MEEENNAKASYSKIFKSTSLFGGVQLFNILISIVRVKATAVIIGPQGVGIISLLTSSLGIFNSIFNLGLNVIGVKVVADSNIQGPIELGKTAARIRLLLMYFGLAGALVVCLFSPYLSRATFGDNSHVWSFIVLSCSIFFNQLTSSYLIVLQGVRKLKLMALANSLGSLISLFLVIPLYYLFGKDVISIGLVIISIVNFTTALFFFNKIRIQSVKCGFKSAFYFGKPLMIQGFSLMLSGLLVSLSSYSFNLYLNNYGSSYELGVYNAGFQLVGTYVGFIFGAMATDYLPRLASVSKLAHERNRLVNQQSIISLYILLPFILLFLVYGKFLIKLFYTAEFIRASDMLLWASFGLIFKSLSWAIGYQIVTNGSGRVFLINEIISATYTLIFNIVGFRYFGLTGLGYAYLFTFIVHCIQVFWYTRRHFGYEISGELFRIITIVCSFCIVAVMNYYLMNSNTGIILGGLIVLVGSFYSVSQLNKKTGIVMLIKERLLK
jgi:O-antigen/teichoic acid export membrane protein